MKGRAGKGDELGRLRSGRARKCRIASLFQKHTAIATVSSGDDDHGGAKLVEMLDKGQLFIRLDTPNGAGHGLLPGAVNRALLRRLVWVGGVRGAGTSGRRRRCGFVRGLPVAESLNSLIPLPSPRPISGIRLAPRDQQR